MEPNTTDSTSSLKSNSNGAKTSALDFFLHLGSIVALYVVVGNFVNLLFRIIDRAFPAMITNSYYWTQGLEISFPVATLIVVFPIFVLLSWLIHKTYNQNNEKKSLAIRKWLTYVTLFFAGIFLAGDLVAVLYKFLDGQDLTSGFLLKALVVFVVSSAVFGFYLQDIRERISSKQRNVWAIVVALLILVSIVLGFSVIGSPKSQRMLREDNLTLNDLQNIEWGVINYWTTNGIVPEKMPGSVFTQREIENYEYKKTGNLNYEICATFNLSDESWGGNGRKLNIDTASPTKGIGPGMMAGSGGWAHKAGYQCFERLIDPIKFPTQVRG